MTTYKRLPAVKTVLFNLTVHFRLLVSLVKKDLKTRYAGSLIGLFWNVVHPLVLFSLYYFVCVFIFRLKLGKVGYGYAEFLFCGLWPWITFAEAISRCTSVFVENSSIIKKVMFPVELLVLTVVGVSLVQLVAGLGVFSTYLLWQGKLSANIFLLPVAIILQLLFTTGFGLMLATFNVFWRDLQEVVTVFLNVWFYATPIIYPLEMIPQKFRILFYCNPFYYVVTIYRWTIIGAGEFRLKWLILMILGLVLFSIMAFRLSRTLKKDFAVFL